MPDPLKPGEPGYVDPALKKDEPKPGESGYVEPKKDEPKPGEEPKKEPLSAKLEGDKVPEKFRGKTIAEALTLMGATDTELTKAKEELKQWYKFGQELETQKAGETKEKQFDPMEHLDEDQGKAIMTLIGEAMKPFGIAMDAYMLERVEQTRPDFGEYKERAMKIFRDLPTQHKYHPLYGLDFAYRFAKAEKEGGPPPPGPGPSHMGPSNVGGDTTPKEGALTKAELYVAEKMNMSPESYKKYKEEQSPTEAIEAKTKIGEK